MHPHGVTTLDWRAHQPALFEQGKQGSWFAGEPSISVSHENLGSVDPQRPVEDNTNRRYRHRLERELARFLVICRPISVVDEGPFMVSGHAITALLLPQAAAAMPATEPAVLQAPPACSLLSMARPSQSLASRGMHPLRSEMSEMGSDRPDQIHRPAVSAGQSASAKRINCPIQIPTHVSSPAHSDRVSTPWRSGTTS